VVARRVREETRAWGAEACPQVVEVDADEEAVAFNRARGPA